MKVVVAIDSFKGSLSSRQAGEAVRAGVLRAVPGAEVLVKPIADGGEGTVTALLDALQGQSVSITVTGPYGEPVEASYGWLPQEGLAVMEMAAAAGITLSTRRAPGAATTFGVGEMILDALERGCRRFIIGIGGSATNDGGLGMLSALGFTFVNRDGIPCGICGDDLEQVFQVRTDRVPQALHGCQFMVASDVNNPLCGAQGCTFVYGPQKGIALENRQAVDRAMGHFADVTAAATGTDYRNSPGAGAAGGLGFAFLSYLGGTIRPGIDLILEALHLEDCMEGADVVVTGEGCIDSQTAYGKVPSGVAACAKKYHIPVIGLAGVVKPGAQVCNARGMDAFFPILSDVIPLEQAMEPRIAQTNLSNTAEQVFRLLNVAQMLQRG